METNIYGIESLWQQGDLVIRSVAVILLLMSILSWTVMLLRTWNALVMRRTGQGVAAFWHAHSIAEGLAMLGRSDPANPFRSLVEAAQAASDHHDDRQSHLQGKLPLADWLTSCLRNAMDESAERMQRGLSLLASVGSTAPFVGLFGTVWGIYHALVSIGVSGQASIDKVAGPVGEALIMTAFGLVVAIPAVLGYNALTRHNKRVLGKLNRFAHELHAFYLTGAPLKARVSDSITGAVKPAKEVR